MSVPGYEGSPRERLHCGVGVTVPDERPYGDRLRYTKIDIFKLAWEAKVS